METDYCIIIEMSEVLYRGWLRLQVYKGIPVAGLTQHKLCSTW